MYGHIDGLVISGEADGNIIFNSPLFIIVIVIFSERRLPLG